VHAGVDSLVAKVHGAGDVVIAVGRDTSKTPKLRVTPFRSIAELAIVAVFRRPWHTPPHRAIIPFSAYIVVIAGGIVIDMNAPLCAIAGIVRAWIVVVAIEVRLRLANPTLATAFDRAKVVVLAYLSFVLSGHLALTCFWVAHILQTKCVSRWVAFHRKRSIQHALIRRRLRLVAYHLSIARVRRRTVLILGALTNHLFPWRANTSNALVSYSAWLAIVAQSSVSLWHLLASATIQRFIAGICLALSQVVPFVLALLVGTTLAHTLIFTNALLALVIQGARVTIVAKSAVFSIP
jgi:hypothetical protein